ncbi:hypothetical protein [Moraxella caviae]|uniref:hypothetical protein n=1 Tax=Moraxella caviae TaxID=34060 RepID=UPI0013011690|nr:hypothetical protein [Moraxella caviae]
MNLGKLLLDLCAFVCDLCLACGLSFVKFWQNLPCVGEIYQKIGQNFMKNDEN